MPMGATDTRHTLLGHICPRVTWFAIRLMLSLVLLHEWSTLTVDFVLAYPQVDIDSETYIKLPEESTSEPASPGAPMY